MYTLGKTNNQKLAYDVGKVMAEQLRTIGVNVVFAPVLDIYSNENNTVIGDRSFGKTDEQVSNMAISLAKGLEDNGVIATYKHFPGHGDTDVDSHKDLPVVHKTYDEIDKFELVPFKKAIENDAKIIMVGHLYFDNIVTDGKPSSLSKEIITDILYKKLNYNGLVITDALNMGALTKNYSDEDIYTMAIEAGSDLILMPRGSKKTIEYIKKNISEDRINKSVEKILKFKYTYLSDYEYLDKSYLNNKEQQNIISKIGE
jgi:beta-N-acetylhexosaminidase